jgi:precorrin-2 dehydrogenase/sirohydrochlorin ferrochelatase
MIPLYVDCSERRIVIFGGGEVASRKAAYFAGKADVSVISRSFSPKMRSLDVRRHFLDVSTRTDGEIQELFAGAFLVIGALSDPAQNNRIGRLCRQGGILFNNADGEPGDTILPSVTGGNNYLIAISTKGSSPALSRFIREHLEGEFPALDAMVLLQKRLREYMKRAGTSPSRRNAIIGEVLKDRTVWDGLRTDPDLAWEQVRQRYFHD